MEDKLKNYDNITYELIGNGGNTLLGITQDNIETAEMFNRISQNREFVCKRANYLITYSN